MSPFSGARIAREIKPSLQEFRQLCARTTTPHSYPLSQEIVQNVPIYDGAEVLSSSVGVQAEYQDEWYRCLLSGPGVFVVKGMFTSSSSPTTTYSTTTTTTTTATAATSSLLDRVNTVYDAIIAAEKAYIAAGGGGGDHFAADRGKNTRLWNSLQKHALADAVSFYEYYSNPLLSLLAESWLGPAYRVTAQLNIVAPGSKAQLPHRDYHLGFQTAEATARFPLAMQAASQLLTLQGAVAHTDMPIESGPTKLLPFSQGFEMGFLAYREKEFVNFFEEAYVQIPLKKGDGLFFSPSLFHAAGENRTSNIQRSSNLLQISSAFGKPMEKIDTASMILHTWPVLKERFSNCQGEADVKKVDCFIKAVAEGYPFPVSLDHVPPRPDGLAPESEQELVNRALNFGWTKDTLEAELMRRRVIYG